MFLFLRGLLPTFAIASILFSSFAVAADKRGADGAIFLEQPIEDAVAMLRQRRIETRTEGFQEIRHNPDSAEVIFDLEKGVIARVFYSVSKKRVVGILLTVYPSQGATKITQREMKAKSIRIEDDGSYVVHHLPPAGK